MWPLVVTTPLFPVQSGSKSQQENKSTVVILDNLKNDFLNAAIMQYVFYVEESNSTFTESFKKKTTQSLSTVCR